MNDSHDGSGVAVPASGFEAQNFSEKDIKLLAAAMCSLKPGWAIDYERLKVNAGFNTVKTATNNWGKMKKRIDDVASPNEEVDHGVPARDSASPIKKRGKGTNVADEPNDEPTTPKKKQKARSTTKTAGKNGENEGHVKSEGAGEMVV